MRKLLLLISVACLLAGCSEPMIAAFGSNSEVVIVTLPRCKDQASILKSILEREVQTVQYEKAFQVRIVTTGDVRREHNRKNIILLDYLEPESLLTDQILGLSGRDKEALKDGTLNRKALHDRWAKGQVLLIIAARTRYDLEKILAGQAEELFGFVSGAVQARLNRALFHAGEQTAVSQRLTDSYGWSLRLPPRYEVDETYASQRVIKVLQDKPTRMITVYWEGGRWDDMTGTCLERKKMLAWEFWDQDEVVEETLQVGEGRFAGHDAITMSGMWENKKYTIGGVFATYCFSCDKCQRNYIVDAAVFAPGLEKLPLMRELNAILVTFECCKTE
jgi:hypothetical protein